MALLDNNSSLVLNSGLDLFTVLPTDISVENWFYENFNPTSSLDVGDTITFIISKQYQHYIDLSNTLLYAKFKLTDENGNDLSVDTHITTINNGLHSLFSYIEVYFNDKQIAGPVSKSYSYLALIKRLLYEDKSVRDYYGFKALFNEVPDYRGDKTKGSQNVELMDNIFLDIFQQEKYLIPGVELKLKFKKNTKDFLLLSYFKNINTTKELSKLLNKGINIKLLDINIRVKKVTVSSKLQIAHETILKNGKPVKYIIDKELFKYVQIEKGATNYRIENIFLNYIPASFILLLVDANAYNGSLLLDPYKFQHFNTSEIAVYVNNNILANKILKTDFENKHFVEAYSNFLQSSGMSWSNNFNIGLRDREFIIRPIFFFNISSNPSMDTHFNLVKNGDLRIELTFRKPLSQAVNVILIASKPSVIQINSNRNVTIED